MWISKVEYELLIERKEEFKQKMYKYRDVAQGLCLHENTIEKEGTEITYGNGNRVTHIYTECLLCGKIIKEEWN